MNGYDAHSLSFREASGDLPPGAVSQSRGAIQARRDNRMKRNFGWRPVPFRDTVERYSEATLTTRQRKQLPVSDFAIPAKRAFPIPDEDHARAALARMGNASPDDQARIRNAVKRKFPQIQVAGGAK